MNILFSNALFAHDPRLPCPYIECSQAKGTTITGFVRKEENRMFVDLNVLC